MCSRCASPPPDLILCILSLLPPSFSVVNFYLINRVFPSDSNAVYMVLTDPSVSVASPNANDGFCTHFCGYHSYGASLNGQILKFGFVGHASRCPSKCIRNLPL